MGTMSQRDVERVAKSYVPGLMHDLQAAGFTDQQSQQLARATEKFVAAVVTQVLDESYRLPDREFLVV